MPPKKIIAAIIDTETTGFLPPVAAIQLVYYPIMYKNPAKMEPWHEEMRVEMFHPGKPIEYGAMAAHGITMRDLEGAQPWEGYQFPLTPDYFIGHSVDYDVDVIRGTLPEAFRPQSICTYSLAKLVFPECDSHKLVALAYYLSEQGLVPEAYVTGWKALIKRAHDAEADVHMCAGLLMAIMQRAKVTTWERLHQLSELGKLPVDMPFGKYKGRPIWEVPSDYRRWLAGQTDVDPGLLKALTMPKDAWADHSKLLEEVRGGFQSA